MIGLDCNLDFASVLVCIKWLNDKKASCH